MIKLEDLKINDIVYSICEDGNYVGQYEPSKVIHELCMIDVNPKPIEGVVVKGGHEIITRSMEKYLYRTEKEVEYNIEILINNKAEQLLQSEEFVDKLFECATTSKRLDRYGDRIIFKRAVELYKEKLNDKNDFKNIVLRMRDLSSEEQKDMCNALEEMSTDTGINLFDYMK